MVPCSYLRIYQPLDSFAPREREKWEDYIEQGARIPAVMSYRDVAFKDGGNTGIIYPSSTDHAFVRRVGSQWMVCPWHIRLRVLVGLLAFRNSLPVDVADHFVPEAEAERAVRELDVLRDDEPEMRANIAAAPWHVPLRWFVAFEDAERILRYEGDQLRIAYETDLAAAKQRVTRGLRVLTSAGLPLPVVELVQELEDWLNEFPVSSLLELDYASVSTLFSSEELESDRSAGEVWACLEALEMGDFDESNRRYSELVSWWSRAQSLQTAN